MIFSCPAKAFPPSPKIYGVEWDWTSSGPTRGVRTDDAVGLGDPNPAVSNGSGSSPFDNLYPWKDMVREDRTGGVMVKEPKYWFKWTRTPSDSGVKLKLQIADGPVDGFHVDPVNMDREDGLGELDCSYIGRYHCASGSYKSETNKQNMYNVTRNQARTDIHNLGSHIWQMDFAQMWYVGMLFLVEFADWDSLRIGETYFGDIFVANGTGGTDSMKYHTGTTAATRDGFGCTQYRNIEGWWYDVFDWVDGCYYNENGLYVIMNPAQFSDNTNGVLVGKPVGGWPSDFSIPAQSGFEWALFPCAAAGTGKDYVPDSWGFDGGKPCLLHGGMARPGNKFGFFCVDCTQASEKASHIGCRLQERPPKTTNAKYVYKWGNETYPIGDISPNLPQVKIRFISDGVEHSTITCYSDSKAVDIFYDDEDVYMYDRGGGYFPNENYATMTFLEPPTPPLIDVLNQYATKIQ